MSVGTKIERQHAPVIARRNPVEGELALSSEGRSPAASAGCHSNHRGVRSQRFDIRAATFAPIDTSPDGPHQRSGSVESP